MPCYNLLYIIKYSLLVVNTPYIMLRTHYIDILYI
nr:MAG TPA: hypothetical protein [Siphoviridae sp. ctcBx5]